MYGHNIQPGEVMPEDLERIANNSMLWKRK